MKKPEPHPRDLHVCTCEVNFTTIPKGCNIHPDKFKKGNKR